MFLEDPSDGLSDEGRYRLWEYFRLIRNRTGIVLTTRYIQESERLADRIFLATGHGVPLSGSLGEILASTGQDNLMGAYVAVRTMSAEEGLQD